MRAGAQAAACEAGQGACEAMVTTTAANAVFAQVLQPSFTIDQVVNPYVYVFYAAFGVSILLTPLMRIVAMHYGIIDRPDNVRKMHSRPIAYLGGIAVFMGWLAGLAVSQFLSLHRSEIGWPTNYPIIKFSIVLGGLVIVVLGLWDDTVGVKPWVKTSRST